MFVKGANKVIFIDNDLEEAFNSLAEKSPLKKSLRNAVINLKENAFCGDRIPKKLIPKVYVQKYGVDNLWWYPLANDWRLVYSIMTPNNIDILAVIVEHFDYKDYERRFKY